jgi:hypothetical protein
MKVAMATRANIELYDGWQQGDSALRWHKGVVLYHHYDGDPTWMGPELEHQLRRAKTTLVRQKLRYWWDSERVGALIVKQSVAQDGVNKGVPRFHPGLELHGDIDYLWRVFLGPEVWQYDIQCFRVKHDWEKDLILRLEPVDWRQAVKQ